MTTFISACVSRFFVVGIISALCACGGGGGAPLPTNTTSISPAPSMPALSTTASSAPAPSTPASNAPATPTTGTSVSESAAPSLTDSNVSRIYVDGGPSDGQLNRLINALYVNIKVCAPGGAPCALIDHMLVDTGSVGIRFFANALPANVLAALPQATTGAGLTAECIAFSSATVWGGVRKADVYLGGSSLDGSLAANIPVHVIADPDTRLAPVPASCESQGALSQTSGILGAKGVLGIGLFAQDCGGYCASAPRNIYYACPASGSCASSTMPLASQIPHPLVALATDNNGSSIVLPAIPGGSASIVEGMLVFGVGTRSNNTFDSRSSVLGTNSAGLFSSVFNGRTLPKSFIDSGSSVTFLPSGGTTPLPVCSGNQNSFLCPTPNVTLDAVNSGRQNTSSIARVFVVNAANAFAARPNDNAIAGLSGTIFSSLPDAMDLGATFLFGRSTVTLIEKRSAVGVPILGPAFAYTP